MLIKEVTVVIENGFHLRPATQFLRIVKAHESKVVLIHRGNKVNGHSLFEILKLCLVEGSTVTLMVDGPDEEEVLKLLVEQFESLF
jgi:phosphotransferase system HPr (HPr) family protein